MSKTPRITKNEAIRTLAAYGHAACDRVEQLETELADKDRQLAEANRKLAERINDDQRYLVAPLCNAEKALDDCQAELAEARAEIERLNKDHNDALDTIFAMLIAARGEDCTIEVLHAEMNAVSTKPSEYIKHVIAERDKLVEQMREALRLADDLIDEYAADYEHRDNVDEIREKIKSALAAERGWF